VVTGRQDPAGEYENLQLTTLQGWRQFVTEMRSVPQLLAGPVWSGLGEEKRAAYDDDRIDHHSRLLVVQTPTIREVINSGRRLIQLNKTARYGRCGLIVSGPARTGKTTALAQLGKTIEVIHRRRYPQSASDVPVVYITLPPAATPKMIAMEFARFFGLPLSRRANITDITEAVCGVCLDTRVTLVQVDELHNLNTATRAGAEASDTCSAPFFLNTWKRAGVVHGEHADLRRAAGVRFRARRHREHPAAHAGRDGAGIPGGAHCVVC